MGGELSVKSQKGAGTTFTIVLPLERAQKAEAPAPQPEPPETRDFKGKRVLVTEDNALNCLLYTSTSKRIKKPGAENLPAGDKHRRLMSTVFFFFLQLFLLKTLKPLTFFFFAASAFVQHLLLFMLGFQGLLGLGAHPLRCV